MNEQETTFQAADEVSLKDIISTVQEFIKEVFKNWKIIGLLILLMSGIMLYNAFITPPFYSCNLTFMLNEDGGNNKLGGLAASFGLGIGGEGVTNMEKMLALSKSRKIIGKVLFEEIEVKGEKDFCINHIIKIYKYHDEWTEDSGLKGLLFTHYDKSKFTRKENKALKILHSRVIGDKERGIEGLFKSSLDEITGIMVFNVTSESEDLSIYLSQAIFNELKEFYISSTVEKEQITYDITKTKVDSLKMELNSAQYRLLKLTDSTRGLLLKQFENEQLKLRRQLEVLSVAYSEAMKHHQIADFSLQSNMPFITAIDIPIYPLSPIISSKIKAILLGFIIGGFLGGGFIVVRKIFRDAMKD